MERVDKKYGICVQSFARDKKLCLYEENFPQIIRKILTNQFAKKLYNHILLCASKWTLKSKIY